MRLAWRQPFLDRYCMLAPRPPHGGEVVFTHHSGSVAVGRQT